MFAEQYLEQAKKILESLDVSAIEKMAELLSEVREKGGRLFFLGVGGSAASASHAVNDFRKICGFEAYTPTDNVAELSARVNDDGWESVFARWLEGSRLRKGDAVFVFSVGGGNKEKQVSANIVEALLLAKKAGAFILGVVGRDGGYTAQTADACVVIPTVDAGMVTPHTEAFHGVIWHLLVSHPKLKTSPTKWEAVK